MQFRQSLIIWSLIFLVLGGFVYLVSSVLFPFVFAAVLAYFLDPITDKVEKTGFSRTISTIIVISGFSLVLLGLLFFMGPIFVDQFKKLSVHFPQIMNEFDLKSDTKLHRWVNKVAPNLDQKIQDFAYTFTVQIIQFLATSIQSIITSGTAVFNLISLIVISPVVAFYLLRDWDVMVKKIDDLLPRANLGIIRHEFSKIDDTVSAYIRGQVSVCIIMGVFYSVNLSLIGLDYAIAIGVMTGLLSFIPYVGMTIGMCIALLVAFFQFANMDGMLFTLVVFILGNLIEGNFITPKLVGDKVNLHPVWIIFALLAGGAIMGFTGIMLAIPLAAIMGVLVRSLISKYRKSSLYLGYSIMALEKPASSNTNPNTTKRNSAPYDANTNRGSDMRNADVFGFDNLSPRLQEGGNYSDDASPKPRRGRPPKKG